MLPGKKHKGFGTSGADTNGTAVKLAPHGKRTASPRGLDTRQVCLSVRPSIWDQHTCRFIIGLLRAEISLVIRSRIVTLV